MEELAEDNKGEKVQIVKVNVEQNPELSQKFEVSSIPVVFLMKGENPVGTII
jgi:thioredoxin-like negative regulator of GroEL